MLRLINVSSLFHQLFLGLAVVFPFEISARFVGYIAQFVKDAALIENTVSIHVSQGFSQATTPITYDHLQTLLGSYSTLLHTPQEHFPLGMIFTVGQLPVQDFSSAIGPESHGHQDHDFLPAALMAFALTLVRLDFCLLALNRDPNAVTLDDGWSLGEMLFPHAMHQRLYLIDELIERA